MGTQSTWDPLEEEVHAMGTVSVFTTPKTVVGAGIAFHLQPALLSYASGGANCTEKNGCGAHVHSGFSCENTTTQGGHYFNGSVDPWAVVGYTSTDRMGNASF